eukprot:COSAG04_NODE_24642_length_319_cov_0.468182_1_plen_30_part_01
MAQTSRAVTWTVPARIWTGSCKVNCTEPLA